MNDKLEFVKQTLIQDILPTISSGSHCSVKTFFADDKKIPVVNEIVKLDLYNLDIYKQAIQDLKNPNGNTPIAFAIKNSIDSLKEYRLYDKKIILITDGEENCGGDYEQEAKKAGEAGFFCEIHVIGIGLNNQHSAKAKSISIHTKGTFSDIKFISGSTYTASATDIKGKLSAFKQAYSKQIEQTSIKMSVAPAPVAPAPVAPASDSIKTEANDSLKELSNQVNSSITKLSQEIQDIKNLLKNRENDETFTVFGYTDKSINEQIRLISETYLFDYLKRKYSSRVKWLNESSEQFQDHDFEIMELDNKSIEYYIECKGTSNNKMSFLLTASEWRRFLNSTKNYQIYFIQNCDSKPNHIFIDNLLDWLLKGKIIPYSFSNTKLPAERIQLTIL